MSIMGMMYGVCDVSLGSISLALTRVKDVIACTMQIHEYEIPSPNLTQAGKEE